MGKKVTFEPYGLTVEVPEGENLLRAALSAGVHINASCGGEGVCGKCKILLESGDLNSLRGGLLSNEEWDLGYRQACQSWVRADAVVRIPPESLLDRRTLTRRRGGIGLRPSPIDITSRSLPFFVTKVSKSKSGVCIICMGYLFPPSGVFSFLSKLFYQNGLG